MAVVTTNNKVKYTITSGVYDYSFDFLVLKHEDLKVYIYDNDNNETQLTFDVDYIINGIGDENGGYITLLTTQTPGYTLLIYREVKETQETRYTEGDPFPAEEHEKALDKLTMITQQLSEKIKRALLRNVINDSINFNGASIYNLGSANGIDTNAVNLDDVKSLALVLNGNDYDAKNKHIKNVANPDTGTDVCNYQTVVSLLAGNISIHNLTEKETTIADDEIIIADSEDNYTNKKVLLKNVVGTSGGADYYIDGGSSSSVYLVSQVLNGGDAKNE